MEIDAAVRASRQDDWRSNPFKIKKLRNAIRAALESAGAQVEAGRDATRAGAVREPPTVYVTRPLESPEERVERILALVKNQDEY